MVREDRDSAHGLSYRLDVERGLSCQISRTSSIGPTQEIEGVTFVVYGGAERFPLESETEAIGLSELAARLSSSG